MPGEGCVGCHVEKTGAFAVNASKTAKGISCDNSPVYCSGCSSSNQCVFMNSYQVPSVFCLFVDALHTLIPPLTHLLSHVCKIDMQPYRPNSDLLCCWANVFWYIWNGWFEGNKLLKLAFLTSLCFVVFAANLINLFTRRESTLVRSWNRQRTFSSSSWSMESLALPSMGPHRGAASRPSRL